MRSPLERACVHRQQLGGQMMYCLRGQVRDARYPCCDRETRASRWRGTRDQDVARRSLDRSRSRAGLKRESEGTPRPRSVADNRWACPMRHNSRPDYAGSQVTRPAVGQKRRFG
jgi:hypothetical protein